MSFDLTEIEPLGNYVLLELEDDAGNQDQRRKSGIWLSFTLQKEEVYAPVYGKVLKLGESVSQVELGDKCFFHYLSYENGKHTNDKWQRGIYFPEVHSFEQGEKKYLVIREQDLLFAVRKEEIIALNENVILRSIPLELQPVEVPFYKEKSAIIYTSSSTIIQSKGAKDYRTDIAEVVAVPKEVDLKKGDIVYPDKDWDVNAEYEILSTLDFPIFYIHKDYIGGKCVS